MGQRLHYAWVSLGAAWLGFLSFGLIRSIYPYAVPAMQDSLQISHATMAAVISCFFLGRHGNEDFMGGCYGSAWQ